MKLTIYTFTRINNYGDLIDLEHFGREDNADAAMEKSIAAKLDYLKSCGWDITNENQVRVERAVDGKSAVLYYGESHEDFDISERTIEIEAYIV